MAKGNSQKKSDGSALDFEAQLWAAAEQAVPAPRADSFRADLHPDLKADFILANPPFNMSDWGGENLRQDVRWKFGLSVVEELETVVPANLQRAARLRQFILEKAFQGSLA